MSTEPSGLRAPASFAGPATPEAAEGTRTEEARTEEARSGDTPPGGTPSTAPSAQPRSATPAARTRQRPPEANRERVRKTPPPRRKRKARKVHRVVHHLEVWSVAKVTAAFVACGYVAGMISGFLLWQAADRVGTIEGIEGFIESSAAYESFDILGGVVFRVAAVTGLVLGFAVIAVAVLGAVLFNLISDLTGGIRMTVIDEDLIVAPARRPDRPESAGPN